MISNIYIINIGVSVIYFENQCFLQLFIPKLLQTIVSCQTRHTMKVNFLDKIQFFDHINMISPEKIQQNINFSSLQIRKFHGLKYFLNR